MQDSQQTPGQRIRAARERLKMKQVEFARRVGVSAVSASDWERDVYSPSDENWEKIATVLDVPRKELEDGFGANVQDTFNAGVREGLRRAVDAVGRLALEVVGRSPNEHPIVSVDRVELPSPKRKVR